MITLTQATYALSLVLKQLGDNAKAEKLKSNPRYRVAAADV